MIEKHAYLIMAHGNYRVLMSLLKMLDDKRNDIYLHLAKKSADAPINEIWGCIKCAKLNFTKRINVSWGGYSQIRAELLLLKDAVKTEHTYYHLLSGVDLPLKSQDEIHAFFQDNKGKEFISIDNVVQQDDELVNRVKYYYFFHDQIGRNPGRIPAFLYRVQQILLKIQRCLCVNRVNNQVPQLYKGGNWFSITHEMAKHVLLRERQIRRLFKHGICVDEMFLQTIAMDSPFRDNVTGYCMRHIDWSRGNPYTFTSDDYAELISGDMLFARKFSQNQYEIVMSLQEYSKQH